MIQDARHADLVPVVSELQDAFARVRAQLHVIRLALAAAQNERDARALLSQIGAIEEELLQSEAMLKPRGAAH